MGLGVRHSHEWAFCGKRVRRRAWVSQTRPEVWHLTGDLLAPVYGCFTRRAWHST